MSEAIKGNGIRAYIEQPSGDRTLGTATWTGAGYTVDWDDGFQDVNGVVYHFGPGDISLKLVDTDEEDDNDYPERCELCVCEEDEEESFDIEDALNATLYVLGEAVGMVRDGDDFEASIEEILGVALAYIAIAKRVL